MKNLWAPWRMTYVKRNIGNDGCFLCQKLKEDKKDEEKAILGDLVIFDYTATIDEKPFKGNEGKNIQLTLGKDLFLKGFDEQLLGVKKGEQKVARNFNLANLTKNKEKISGYIFIIYFSFEIKVVFFFCFLSF